MTSSNTTHAKIADPASKPIKHVVIAGGGTAGWMAAAAIAKTLGSQIKITVVESELIGTVGVGEATIPSLAFFHQLLDINEREFMHHTQATFKLGIHFEDWKTNGQSYFHGFGVTGKDCWAAGFQHFWLRARKNGVMTEFGDYCLEACAAKQHRFAHMPQNGLNYAYHLDASAYARFLKDYSKPYGVNHIVGNIQQVELNPQTGFIERLRLDDHSIIEGDFFLDCTGFRALLSQKALRVGYEDWSHWLINDSAVAQQTQAIVSPVPYTKATAHTAGWQWQIPLQHRVGNGLVYSRDFMNDEQAMDLLQTHLEGEPRGNPKLIRFKTGRRLQPWFKNCLALGLSSGFLEPLESTSIHLIQQGIVRFLRMFPTQGIAQRDIEEYNKQTLFDVEHIRDFIILHYKVTARQDSDYWQYCRNMTVPDSLAHRIELFEQTGRVFREGNELFDDSWQQVMIGQGIMPNGYHPMVDTMSKEELRKFLAQIQENIARTVQSLPVHSDYLTHYGLS